MAQSPQELYRMIRAVRGCFHALKALSDTIIEDHGLNLSLHAVLETVCESRPMTVPQIARLKGVSRQHVQVTVDALVDKGLVTLTANPAHKRSSLVVGTDRGREVFTEIRGQELPVLEDLAAALDTGDVTVSAVTLDALTALCEARLEVS